MSSKKELHMVITDGEKRSEITIEDFDPKHQLAIMDGVFKFFDVQVDFAEMTKVYLQAGQAFREFYEPLEDPQFTEVNEQVDIETEKEEPKIQPKEEVALSPKEQKIAAIYEEVYQKENDSNNPYKDIKMKDGVMHFKCHYICPKCKNRANHYIQANERIVDCHECYTRLKVRPATKEGLPNKDHFGNYFVAGAFK